MDITFIAIAFFILVAVISLLIFLFKSINKKSFIAEDGSSFDNQLDLELYNSLYDKTKPIFSDDEEIGTNQPILGFDRLFLIKLKKEGFRDLKTVVKYRKQLILLSDLINT
tara:strand:+ start:185 stop:517 length:333 start_codon:yes stop_codon:yes gene_type:complete